MEYDATANLCSVLKRIYVSVPRVGTPQAALATARGTDTASLQVHAIANWPRERGLFAHFVIY
jgi:hypothetical protein